METKRSLWNMSASAKTMLRETKTMRHRCEFANSVDSKSKRRKRAQQHRLQERMLQVNRQGDWRDVVVRVVPKVHLPERRINRCFSKSIAEGIRCGPRRELRRNPRRILKQRNLSKDAKKTKQIWCWKLKRKPLLPFLAHWWYTMWPNEGATSKPNEDSQARKSYQGCKENKNTGAKKCKKTLHQFLAHHGCVGFQEKQ